MPLPLKPFFMIRHGQTEANAAEIMAGSLDSPLTALGRDQAKAARDVVAQPCPSNRSPCSTRISRGPKTPPRSSTKRSSVDMHEDPDLAEIHAGEWEGVKYDACRHFLDDWAQAPGGETPDEFFERVKQGKTSGYYRGSMNRYLIVCHGGVMRAFGELYKSAHPRALRKRAFIRIQSRPIEQSKLPVAGL
jgi:broad specificity phosphatase PhoE